MSFTPSSSSESDHASSSSSSSSQWRNLPSDILTTIANLLGPTIGLLRLRSICHPWRSSLPPSSDDLPTTVTLPSPPSTTIPTCSNPLPTLHLHTVLLLTPPPPSPPFLLHIRHSPHPTLLSPLSAPLSAPSSISLLHFGITLVSQSYHLQYHPFFLKSVVSGIRAADLVVLGITAEGNLAVWKHGSPIWGTIPHSVRLFDDIATYDRKFYATADRRGRLLVVDVDRNTLSDVVPCLMYGNGYNTSLVACDLGLFLVDRVHQDYRGPLELEVFKLDEKGRFWDYEYELSDYVFFIGDAHDLTLWLSPNNCCGTTVNNVIYFNNGDQGAVVWDMKTRVLSSLLDNDDCRMLFSPPLPPSH